MWTAIKSPPPVTTTPRISLSADTEVELLDETPPKVKKLLCQVLASSESYYLASFALATSCIKWDGCAPNLIRSGEELRNLHRL